jgi:hypothetical protein
MKDRGPTERLQELLHGDAAQVAGINRVEDVEQSLVLTRHLAPIIRETLSGVRDPAQRVEIVHRLLSVLAEHGLPRDDLVTGSDLQPQQLLSVATSPALGGIPAPLPLRRPVTALSDAALL